MILAKPSQNPVTTDQTRPRTDTQRIHGNDTTPQGNPDDEIHYFSIVNSLMIVLFLTGVVAMIMLRTLRKDISTYNEMQTLEEAQEESGWKVGTRDGRFQFRKGGA